MNVHQQDDYNRLVIKRLFALKWGNLETENSQKGKFNSETESYENFVKKVQIQDQEPDGGHVFHKRFTGLTKKH